MDNALPQEVHFENATLPSAVAGNEASTVLCVDAPPAKQLRAANRGDTLQVQILLVHVADGVGHSPRRPMKGLEPFHTNQLMCHCLC